MRTFRPPRHLSREGKRFWRGVNEQYVLTPDGAAVLRVAAENWDRAQQAREQVTREGLTVEGHRNPACDIERQA